MKLKQITVPPQGEGERADRLIRRYFPELPERSVRAAFLRRDVKLDGKRVPKETAAKAGQELRIYLPDEEEEIPLEIIYEDGDVLLVNKPAGISVEPDGNLRRRATGWTIRPAACAFSRKTKRRWIFFSRRSGTEAWKSGTSVWCGEFRSRRGLSAGPG